jgi:uncharacterized protein (UPF0332 family)
LNSKSHSGVINLFGSEIVGKGLVSADLGKLLNRAHALRQKRDYDPQADFEFEDVENW